MRTDKESAKEINETLTNRLKGQGIPTLFTNIYIVTVGFMIDGFSIPYCCGRNAHGGGILVYFRNNITVKLLKLENLPSDIEAIFPKMNIKSTK